MYMTIAQRRKKSNITDYLSYRKERNSDFELCNQQLKNRFSGSIPQKAVSAPTIPKNTGYDGYLYPEENARAMNRRTEFVINKM
jgi:hypothetical protein